MNGFIKGCYDCEYFEIFAKDDNLFDSKIEQGYCKRYPPIRGDSPFLNHTLYEFPIVLADEWCGEHR